MSSAKAPMDLDAIMANMAVTDKQSPLSQTEKSLSKTGEKEGKSTQSVKTPTNSATKVAEKVTTDKPSSSSQNKKSLSKTEEKESRSTPSATKVADTVTTDKPSSSFRNRRSLSKTEEKESKSTPSATKVADTVTTDKPSSSSQSRRSLSKTEEKESKPTTDLDALIANMAVTDKQTPLSQNKKSLSQEKSSNEEPSTSSPPKKSPTKEADIRSRLARDNVPSTPSEKPPTSSKEPYVAEKGPFARKPSSRSTSPSKPSARSGQTEEEMEVRRRPTRDDPPPPPEEQSSPPEEDADPYPEDDRSSFSQNTEDMDYDKPPFYMKLVEGTGGEEMEMTRVEFTKNGPEAEASLLKREVSSHLAGVVKKRERLVRKDLERVRKLEWETEVLLKEMGDYLGCMLSEDTEHEKFLRADELYDSTFSRVVRIDQVISMCRKPKSPFHDDEEHLAIVEANRLSRLHLEEECDKIPEYIERGRLIGRMECAYESWNRLRPGENEKELRADYMKCRKDIYVMKLKDLCIKIESLAWTCLATADTLESAKSDYWTIEVEQGAYFGGKRFTATCKENSFDFHKERCKVMRSLLETKENILQLHKQLLRDSGGDDLVEPADREPTLKEYLVSVFLTPGKRPRNPFPVKREFRRKARKMGLEREARYDEFEESEEYDPEEPESEETLIASDHGRVIDADPPIDMNWADACRQTTTRTKTSHINQRNDGLTVNQREGRNDGFGGTTQPPANPYLLSEDEDFQPSSKNQQSEMEEDTNGFQPETRSKEEVFQQRTMRVGDNTDVPRQRTTRTGGTQQRTVRMEEDNQQPSPEDQQPDDDDAIHRKEMKDVNGFKQSKRVAIREVVGYQRMPDGKSGPSHAGPPGRSPEDRDKRGEQQEGRRSRGGRGGRGGKRGRNNSRNRSSSRGPPRNHYETGQPDQGERPESTRTFDGHTVHSSTPCGNNPRSSSRDRRRMSVIVDSQQPYDNDGQQPRQSRQSRQPRQQYDDDDQQPYDDDGRQPHPPQKQRPEYKHEWGDNQGENQDGNTRGNNRGYRGRGRAPRGNVRDIYRGGTKQRNDECHKQDLMYVDEQKKWVSKRQKPMYNEQFGEEPMRADDGRPSYKEHFNKETEQQRNDIPFGQHTKPIIRTPGRTGK